MLQLVHVEGSVGPAWATESGHSGSAVGGFGPECG